MQVALDHYQILTVPLQADEAQIERAYQERLQALEQDLAEHGIGAGFSPQAHAARRQLLEVAAEVLLEPRQRKEYEAHVASEQATLDLPDELVPGALLILCEIGRFQEALTTATAMLSHPIDPEDEALGDLLLSAALARLELGREAWQQGTYEEAARWLMEALSELEHYQAFPAMRAEITADLGKLRPYRVLQLLSAAPDAAPQRQEGLSLLQAMLDERQGIEGSSQDGSGLTTEDFLRFVQRVRRQMTLEEQQQLFEHEAERPSIVATYLVTQILLARGFLENRPALIRRARGYLVRLAQRQDVHLEHAIASLLLGQTEDALFHLQGTQETEALAFIQSHSAGAPDQLPGLCRFIEKWFQEEVLPEFRQLDQSEELSLKQYFDNPQVQSYLEEMPSSREEDPEALAALVARSSMAPGASPAKTSEPKLPQHLPRRSPITATVTPRSHTFPESSSSHSVSHEALGYSHSPEAMAFSNGGSPAKAHTWTSDSEASSRSNSSGTTATALPSYRSSEDSSPPPSSYSNHPYPGSPSPPSDPYPNPPRSTPAPNALRVPNYTSRSTPDTDLVPPRAAELPTQMPESYPDPSTSLRNSKPGPPDPGHPAHPNRRPRRRPPTRSGMSIPPLVRNIGGAIIFLLTLVIIAQVIRSLFSVGNGPAPEPQPQVQLDDPPLEIAPEPVATPTIPPPTPSIPAEWQGVSTVRVISADGVFLRQEPNVQGAVLGAITNQSEVSVSNVQRGNNVDVPIWLQVTYDQQTGWIAAEVQGTPLVETIQN